MAYAVRTRDSQLTSEAGYEKVAHVPFILDNRPGYHRLGSRYLIDRAIGVWGAGEEAGDGGEVVGTQSLHVYAAALANFLEWADPRLDFNTCTYSEHILGMYQPEMLSGEWSQTGRPLKPSTINQRVGIACDYLKWLAFKGVRETSFRVKTRSLKVAVRNRTNSGPRRYREVNQRVGQLKTPKEQLYLPKKEAVEAWLRDVKAKNGDTFALMAETVLDTAFRESEVVGLRVDTLPESPRDWKISNPTAPVSAQKVFINLKYGVKGPELSSDRDHGDKVSAVEYQVQIPLVLAEKWHAYRNGPRRVAINTLVRSAKTKKQRDKLIAEAVHLFVHPGNAKVQTGTRITQDQLYRAWKGAVLPFREWTVHMGRDWWACQTLMKDLEQDAFIKGLRTHGVQPTADYLASSAMAIIQLVIQPQLRHVSAETTMRYLQWVSTALGVPYTIEWDEALESEDDAPA